jgi:hypothetical protein
VHYGCGLGREAARKPWKFSLGRAISTLVHSEPVLKPPPNPLKLRQMIDSIVAIRLLTLGVAWC